MFLKINFGPYEAHGVIRHKTQKLHGLLRQLSNLGYAVELIPTRFLNILSVEIYNKEIFRCDIRNLKFNMDYEDDETAQLIVNAIEEATTRFESSTNVPAFEVQTSYHSTQELLSPDINLIYEIPHKWNQKRRL